MLATSEPPAASVVQIPRNHLPEATFGSNTFFSSSVPCLTTSVAQPSCSSTYTGNDMLSSARAISWTAMLA
jgi:hypothetical protein